MSILEVGFYGVKREVCVPYIDFMMYSAKSTNHIVRVNINGSIKKAIRDIDGVYQVLSYLDRTEKFVTVKGELVDASYVDVVKVDEAAFCSRLKKALAAGFLTVPLTDLLDIKCDDIMSFALDNVRELIL